MNLAHFLQATLGHKKFIRWLVKRLATAGTRYKLKLMFDKALMKDQFFRILDSPRSNNELL